MKKNRKSDPKKKAFLYLKSFLNSDTCQMLMSNLRRKYDIDVSLDNIADEYHSIGMYLSKDWPYKPLHKKTIELFLEFDGIASKLKIIDPIAVHFALMFYLFHNHFYFDYDSFIQFSPNIGVCVLEEDLGKQLSEFTSSGDKKAINLYLLMKKKFYANYPIGIFLSPIASQNETIIFLQKNWEKIKEAQNKSMTSELRKIKNWRGSNDKVREQNDMILYLHKEGNSYKKISEILQKKFNSLLTYSEVGKIIRREKKKSQKV